MSRRASESGAASPRDRSSTGSSRSSSGGGGDAAGAATSASPSHSPAPTAGTQFVSLRSRVGKRFQAVIPDLVTNEKPSNVVDAAAEKTRYSPDRANGKSLAACWRRSLIAAASSHNDCDMRDSTALGPALDKYLAFARSLRDGATFDTAEQVTALALQYLHRFDYNTTDAACSLYARHSIELPRSALTRPLDDGSSMNSRSSSSSSAVAAADARKWIAAFYQSLRRGKIDADELATLQKLSDRASALGESVPSTEAGVLARLLARITEWEDKCARVATRTVSRAELLQLVYEAEDMQLELAEKTAVLARLQTFGQAYVRIKEVLERSNKRNQPKIALDKVCKSVGFCIRCYLVR